MGAISPSPRPSKATRHVPFWRRALPWLGGIAAFFGAIVLLAVFLGNTANPPKETFSNEPVVDVTKPEKTIPVPPEVKRLAQRFIQTAVARKNLADAYDLVGPSIKQGMSLAEWKTGNIAVIPFPLDELYLAPFKVDYAHPGDIQIFFINVKQFGSGGDKRWLVDNWVPRGSAPVPDGTFRGGS
jgi:hypothetical protein